MLPDINLDVPPAPRNTARIEFVTCPHGTARPNVEGQTALAIRLRGSLEVFDLAHPAGQWVPSGTNLGHQLQAVDSKRLKSSTHFIDRTAGCCCHSAAVLEPLTRRGQRSPRRVRFGNAAPSEEHAGRRRGRAIPSVHRVALSVTVAWTPPRANWRCPCARHVDGKRAVAVPPSASRVLRLCSLIRTVATLSSSSRSCTACHPPCRTPSCRPTCRGPYH